MDITEALEGRIIIKWNDINNGDPESDHHYLVVLHNKFITIAFFFVDSFGSWWSSQWDIWDKIYSEGEVTHWAKLPKTPNQIIQAGS